MRAKGVRVNEGEERERESNWTSEKQSSWAFHSLSTLNFPTWRIHINYTNKWGWAQTQWKTKAAETMWESVAELWWVSSNWPWNQTYSFIVSTLNKQPTMIGCRWQRARSRWIQNCINTERERRDVSSEKVATKRCENYMWKGSSGRKTNEFISFMWAQTRRFCNVLSIKAFLEISSDSRLESFSFHHLSLGIWSDDDAGVCFMAVY